jgi:hypothetical protein
MSKLTDKLLPEDFGKSFDIETFHQWKQSVNEHEQVGITTMILYLAGLALMIILGGLVGVGIFFVMTFIGLGISRPKQNKRKRYQRQLGISNRDVRDAVIVAKKRMKGNL